MEYSRFQIVDSRQVMQQWIWRKLMLCFFCVMGWQPHVCMRMRNT